MDDIIIQALDLDRKHQSSQNALKTSLDLEYQDKISKLEKDIALLNHDLSVYKHTSLSENNELSGNNDLETDLKARFKAKKLAATQYITEFFSSYFLGEKRFKR
jgi:hypothetical protein